MKLLLRHEAQFQNAREELKMFKKIVSSSRRGFVQLDQVIKWNPLLSFQPCFLLLAAAFAALGQARPSYLPSYETIEYAPQVVGYESLALPAAVSHQSSTVVHEKRPYWRPIVHQAPLHTPLLKSYSSLPHYASYDALPLSYGTGEWYEPGWNGAGSALSYPSIYLK